MKHLKSCATALLALAAADAALAATTIRITGSSAFRSGTVTSIKSLLNAGYDVAYNGTSDTGATYITFVGTTNAAGISGQAVVIQCTFTGSVDGIRDVSQGLTQPFIKESYVTATAAQNNAPTVTTVTSQFESVIPDVAMADNTQSATSYTSPSLNEAKVGVVPFVWLKGRVSGSHPASSDFASISNMTGLLAQALLTGGANLSLATGQVDATGTKLYVAGRNPLSGTRLVTFAESGYGATSGATQFKPTITGSVSTGTITAIDLYPAGSGFLIGDNGYSSGGTLADELGRIVADTDGSGNAYDFVPFGLIGYVGVGDAARLLKNINAAATSDVSNVLSYNGVSLNPVYSTGTQSTTWDYTPIKEGKYSFWSYEYLTYRKSAGPNSTTALSGVAKTFADALATDISANVPASTGVKLSDMHVQRDYEGGPITSL